MNQITKTNMTPIEIALGVDEKGDVSAKKLYEWLGLAPQNYARWVRSNITENEFAEENVDFRAFFINEEWGGRATTDYKLTAHFAKKLSMKGNGEKAEQAREYFARIEEKAKETAINRRSLSPNLQMIYAMIDEQAELELEQKRQAEKISKVEKDMTAMKEIFVKPISDWRSEINARIREVSMNSGIPYQQLYAQLYGELESTAHCNLKRLCDNKRERMELAGNTKKAIKDGTTKIALIYDKPQLRTIFENIVKRYAMSYCM